MDNEKNAKKFESKYARKYPIYYDKGKKVSKMLNQIKKRIGLMPAVLLVDKNGIVKYAHYGENMKDIPENDEIITEIKKLNK